MRFFTILPLAAGLLGPVRALEVAGPLTLVPSATNVNRFNVNVTASIASGSSTTNATGAVNVRLGGQALQTRFDPNASAGFLAANAATLDTPTQATPGREPEVAHLRSIVGLVWRSVVLWMVLLALLTLARLLG